MEFKAESRLSVIPFSSNINRIKVEFKGMCGVSSSMCITDINRIKVEFKGGNLQRREGVYLILIESKWNLKVTWLHIINGFCHHINRIKVEFKAYI